MFFFSFCTSSPFLFCLPVSPYSQSLLSCFHFTPGGEKFLPSERRGEERRGAAPDLSRSQVHGRDMTTGLSPWQPHRCWGGGWQSICPTHYCLFWRFCRSGICQGTCWHMVYFFFCLDFFFFPRKALFVFFRSGSNQACGNTSKAICSPQFIQTGALDIKDKQKLSCYSRRHMWTLHFKCIGLRGVASTGEELPTK